MGTGWRPAGEADWAAGELAGSIPPPAAGVESRANGTDSVVSPSPAAVSHRPALLSLLLADRSALAAPVLRIGSDPVCPRFVRVEVPVAGGRLSHLLAVGAVRRTEPRPAVPRILAARPPHPSPLPGEERRFGPICPRLRIPIHALRSALCPECSRLRVRGGRSYPVCSRFAAVARLNGLPSLCPKCSRFVIPPAIRGDGGRSAGVAWGWCGRSAGIRDTGAAISYTSAAKRDTGLGLQSSPPVASLRCQPLSCPLARRDEP